MHTKLKPVRLEKSYETLVDEVKKAIDNAQRIVIGAGAGLSASAGLDYNDPRLFEEKYKVFYQKGFKTIADAISHHWSLTDDNKKQYWGFWANHINTVYYSQEQLDTYLALYDIIRDKNYYVITTNGDGQFYKGDFDTDKVFSMQGSYDQIQCQHGCHNKTYDNKDMIIKMLKGLDRETLEIAEEDVPYCPVCGGLMCPNLRIDQYFVEDANQQTKEGYIDFVNVEDEAILFIELGVGYNTPGIIRYPFEDMTHMYDDGLLIRINLMDSDVPDEIYHKSISVGGDIQSFFKSLKGK